MKWQPIETAPKDGTAVLAYFPDRAGYVARQDVAAVWWSPWGVGTWETSVGGRKCYPPPTHWMPIPEPPGLPGSDGGSLK